MAVTASGRRIRKRKLKAEINVVPYIDVMLVLLIIFMVTAPLLNLGTDINLPQSRAKSLETPKDPIVVSIYADGRLALMLERGKNREMTAADITAELVRRMDETLGEGGPLPQLPGDAATAPEAAAATPAPVDDATASEPDDQGRTLP